MLGEFRASKINKWIILLKVETKKRKGMRKINKILKPARVWGGKAGVRLTLGFLACATWMNVGVFGWDRRRPHCCPGTGIYKSVSCVLL